MLRLIDRQLIISYVKSYMICLISLLSLYIVVDLFNNIDDFSQVEGGFSTIVKHVGLYYAVQITFIFDRLSEAIVLLAAMFTIAWLQRNNELLPLLSAGISTRRVIRPVLLGAFLLIFVNVANQELLIPTLGSIPVSRGDPNHEKNLGVTGGFDSHDVVITGHTAIRKDLKVFEMACTIPAGIAADGKPFPLHAKEAIYVPPTNKELTGGWLLTQTDPPEIYPWNRFDILKPIDTGKYFLYTDLDFDRITRDRNWFQRESTWKIFYELGQIDSTRLASMAVFFHMRLTRPFLGIILVMMGLSVILRDQNRHVFLSTGLCLILCAVFYAFNMAGKYLGDSGILLPALAAWLPVFVFGPVAFVLFDAVHT